MKYIHYLILVLTALTLLSCSKIPEEEFYIMQDGKPFTGDEITVNNRAFTLVSNQKEYSFVFAKKPIKMLADHKEIVKVTGTLSAWYPKQALLYKDSDLLNDKDACDAYYGYNGKGCQEFIARKKALGFRQHYAYTFASYSIQEKETRIESIEDVKIEKMSNQHYYLYFFRTYAKMGKVARAQKITRIKINID